MSRSCLTTGLLLAFFAGLTPLRADAQDQTGVIRGQVVSAGGEPIAEAQAAVLGTVRGARSDQNGTFLITAVPAGEQRVRVIRIGFEAVTMPVSVAAGDTVSVDVRMTPAAVQLSQVIVSATGQEVRQREQGTAASVISIDTVQLAAVPDFSNLIQGRAAGVSIIQSGGTTGSGATVRIRGSNSLSLSNEPLLVIDGVRINSEPSSSTIGVGGQQVGRLNDLNPEEIESIEILKGPAASALYGTAAANGVIQVRTRRGVSGAPQWNVWMQAGAIDQVWDIPDNYASMIGGTATPYGLLDATGPGDIEGLTSFNPLNQSDIFRTGMRQSYGVSVAGGSNLATYFISGEWEDEQGIYQNNDLGKVNLRANVNATPNDHLVLGVQSSYLSSDLQRPQNDNNIYGVLPQGLLGNYEDDANGGFFAFDPVVTERLKTLQGVDRFLLSGNADWRPTPWLNLIAHAGVDRLGRDDSELLPPNVITDSPDNIVGYRQRDRFSITNYTATASAVGSFNLSESVASTSTVGLQFTRQTVDGTNALGYGVLEGTGSLDGTTTRFEVGETNQDERNFGFYGRQQVALNDRLFITGSLRADANSNWGGNVDYAVYPAIDGSWVINEEPFFPQTDLVSTLRLRAAWGQSGLAPAFRTAQRFYTPSAVRVEGSDVVGFTFGGTGNQGLEPEVISETELGFDAGFLQGRVGLEFTYFTRSMKDAIVERRIAPSAGVSETRVENIGELSSNGTEWLLSAQLLKRDQLAWDASLTFTTLSQKVERLREGVEPIIFGLGSNTQRHQPGYSPGGYWALPYTYDDANADGIIQAGEITYGDEQEYVGTPFPKREVGLNTNVSLFNWIRVGAQLDYRGGHKLYNSTEEFRCQFGTCRGINDPNAPLWEQARAVAVLTGGGTVYGFMEDADFVRLREVSLTLTAPQAWANRLRARGLSFTLAGQNLALWTDYTGADPEINGAGQSNFNRFDFLSQPPVRTITGRVQITF